MRKSTAQSLGLRLAGAALALLLCTTPALAQPSDSGGENPLGDRPTATPPPTATPAPAATPAATPAAKPAATTGGIKKKGLVFQFKFGGNFAAVMGSGPVGGGWLNGGFMFGYKLNKLVLGLGIEVAFASYKDESGPTTLAQSTAVVMFAPTIEFYLLVSNPLALYLTAGFHAGFLNVHQDPGADETEAAIGFHAGFGMRFFIHPRFGIGVEGGFRGIWLLLSESDETYGAMSFYGAVTLTAIW